MNKKFMQVLGCSILRKETIWRPRHRLENNIKIDVKQDGRVWTVFILLR